MNVLYNCYLNLVYWNQTYRKKKKTELIEKTESEWRIEIVKWMGESKIRELIPWTKRILYHNNTHYLPRKYCFRETLDVNVILFLVFLFPLFYYSSLYLF